MADWYPRLFLLLLNFALDMGRDGSHHRQPIDVMPPSLGVRRYQRELEEMEGRNDLAHRSPHFDIGRPSSLGIRRYESDVEDLDDDFDLGYFDSGPSSGYHRLNHLGQSVPFSEADYYVSVNPTHWNQAEQDCQGIFQSSGRVGGLLFIESPQEFKNIRLMLEKFGSGQKYWIGGSWGLDADDQEAWMWAGIDKPVSSFAIPQMPVNKPKPTDKDHIFMNVANRFKATFGVDGDTVMVRYICKVLPMCREYSGSMSKCASSELGCHFCAHDGYIAPKCDKNTTHNAAGCGPLGQCLKEGEVSPTLTVQAEPHSPTILSDPLVFCPKSQREVMVTVDLGKQDDKKKEPLDLYILTDCTGSFDGILRSMATSTSDLFQKLGQISSDVQVGFGTFSDKFSGSYSFKNNLALTSDTNVFNNVVKQQTGNCATRDGGLGSQLDALFQVASCTGHIGWRTNAKKIVLLLTDNNFCLPRLQGCLAEKNLTPFPGVCGLGSDGRYTQEEVFNYPDESQVIRILKENDIMPIFVCRSNVKAFYEALSQKIDPSAVGDLQTGNSNIVEIVEEQLTAIRRRKLSLTLGGHNIQQLGVKVETTCNNDQGRWEEATSCKDVGPEGRAVFRIKMSRDTCQTWGVDDYGKFEMIDAARGIEVHLPFKLACEFQ